MTIETLQAEIERLDLAIEVDRQLFNLKAVIDYYELGKYPTNVDDDELIEIERINYMTSAELVRCGYWIAKNNAEIGTKEYNDLVKRLEKLGLRSHTNIYIKISYTDAKTRYKNLLAFKQLKKL